MEGCAAAVQLEDGRVEGEVVSDAGRADRQQPPLLPMCVPLLPHLTPIGA